RRRSRQHLCLRGALSRAAFAATAGCDARDKKGRADRSRQTAGHGDPRGAQSGDQRRRLVAAGSPPDQRRTRLFPALVPGLRPRRREVPDQRLWRHRLPLHPERPLDLLVPEVPKVKVLSFALARSLPSRKRWERRSKHRGAAVETVSRGDERQQKSRHKTDPAEQEREREEVPRSAGRSIMDDGHGGFPPKPSELRLETLRAYQAQPAIFWRHRMVPS